MRMRDYTVHRTASGQTYLQLDDGRRWLVPSGGVTDPAPTETPTDPKPTGDPKPTETKPGNGAEFTPEQQSIFNKALAKQRREIEGKYDPLKTELEAERAARLANDQKLEKALKWIDDIEKAGNPDPADPLDDYVAALQPPDEIAKDPKLAPIFSNLQRERYRERQEAAARTSEIAELKKEQDELKKILATERDARVAAETRSIEETRHALLLNILAKNDVANPAKCARIFVEDLVYDPEKRRFFYRAEDGEKLDPEQGIKSQIEDWMRKPAVTSGGSGSQGSRTTETSPAASVEQLRASYADAVVAAKSNDAAAVNRMIRLKRELANAEKAAKAAGVHA